MGNDTGKGTASSDLTRRGFLTGLGATAASVAAGLAQGGPAKAQAASANNRIGVGFIGCGGRMGAHIGCVQALKDEGHPVELVAVSDVYTARLDAAKERTGGKPYRDHRELLADPNVDVVAIASPDRHHGPQAIDAVRAGKDVYCEKPMTHWQQFDVAKELARAVEENDRVLQLGTQRMADSIWRQAAALIQEGTIGKPLHAQVGYFRQGDWGERGMPILDPDITPGPDLDWDAFIGDAPKRDFDVSRFFRWRMYLDYAGGPPTDLYPHVYTPIATALGLTFPTRVSAAGGKLFYNHEREVPDTVNIMADYPEGVTVSCLGTQVNARDIEWCMRGSEGTMLFDGPGIRIVPADGKPEPIKEVAREHGGDTKEMWANLLDCVRTREKPWSDVQMGYQVQTVMNMGMLSLYEGKMAHFDAEDEEIDL